MKIEFIGNFYLQPLLNEKELQYLTAFSSSVHYDNKNNDFLGLYDISVEESLLKNKNFLFDKTLNLSRSFNKDTQESVFFPFFESPLYFTEKSIKFNLLDIKDKDEFLYFIENLSQSILFYFYHFFQSSSYSSILNSKFFDFFQSHHLNGNVYFKLSQYGEIFRLTLVDDKIALFKGVYPIQVFGKNYLISSSHKYDLKVSKTLSSLYNNLSMIDIKNNATFEEDGTFYSFPISEELSKLLQFYRLNSKLNSKNKDKIHKI